MANEMRDVTDLLLAQGEGDETALRAMVPLVYPELRRIARAQLAGHQRGALLDTTALVHETYLKLVDQTRVGASDRAHFFSLAARTMRQIVVDHARRRYSAKRGGVARRVSLERVDIPVDEQPDLVMAIDWALRGLAEIDMRLATIFDCRYFLGLSEKETADVLGLGLRTVQRGWQKSKAWLRVELNRARRP